MRLLGFEISRIKAAASTLLAGLDRGNWWFPVVREPSAGAWQRGEELRQETVLAYHAAYACTTLIASDIAKCPPKLIERDRNWIWSEIEVPAFSPVLRDPNRYQNHIQFIENWVVSKLLHGNTYVLKQRDDRNVVVALYVLDPSVRPAVAPDGSIYYRCKRDNLAGIDEDVAIPASEIIHDRMTPLYHPLCGVSPLYASGVAAMLGLSIQRNSARFFENNSMPGGVLTAPGRIDEATAARFKKDWEEKFSGNNVGRVAVLGDGLKYESMAVNPVDADMIQQLKWTASVVCSAFKVPPYKVGVGDPPPYQNIQATKLQYYEQCLQKLIEDIELLLANGLGLPSNRGVELDTDNLLRMDTATLVESEAKATSAGIKEINEARKRLGYGPTAGGDAAYLQQQNYSLSALAKRDASADPFASKNPALPAPPVPKETEPDNDDLSAITQMAQWETQAQLAAA